MAIKVSWIKPDRSTVTEVRIKRAATKTGTYTTIATQDAQDSKGDWDLDYIDTDGVTTSWYKVQFCDSVLGWLAESDAIAQAPTGSRMQSCSRHSGI